MPSAADAASRPAHDEMDVFISYSWRQNSQGRPPDSDLAARLHKALEERDMVVWRDMDRIGRGDVIHAALEQGIRTSTLVVPLLSTEHQQSNVCRWEMLNALAWAPTGLLLPLLPVTLEGNGVPGVYPHGLFDNNVIAWDGGDATLPGLCDLISAQVLRLRKQGGARPDEQFRSGTVGAPGVTGSRFVGRLPTVLRMYARLLGGLAPLDAAQLDSRPLLLLRGEPGMGKSSLAGFFAERFSGRYEHGVLWLDAAGDRVDNDATTDVERDTVLRSITAGALRWLRDRSGGHPVQLREADAQGAWEEARGLVAQHLAPSGGSLLVVLDDVPRGMAISDLLLPAPRTSHLFTSRSDHLEQEGVTAIKIEEFEEFESRLVLENARDPDSAARRRREPVWATGEDENVDALVGEVGHHPMAVDLLGLRLRDHNLNPSDLLSEVRSAGRDFLDQADVLLPLAHRGSILATVAGSLRAASRATPEAASVLRMLSVTPAGRPVDSRALESGLASVGLHGAGTVSGDLDGRGLARSVSVRGEQALAQHQIIRAVVRELWKQQVEPFDGKRRPQEPGLCWALAQWHHELGEQLRNADDVRAEEVHSVVLDVLDEGGLEGHVGPIQALHRLYGRLAAARLIFRAADTDSVADYDPALEEIDRAKRELEPFRGSPATDFAFHTAEALQGLVMGARAKNLTEGSLAGTRAGLDLVLQADEARRSIAESVLALPPERSPLDQDYVRDVLARSRFNIPGRAIGLVKALRTEQPPGWVDEARQALRQGAIAHQEVIALRLELWDDNLTQPSRRLSIAASWSGIGMMSYFEALLPGTSADRMQLLAAAMPAVTAGLQMRDEARHEGDVVKSLNLLLKVLLAASYLESGPRPGTFTELHMDRCRRYQGELAEYEGKAYTASPDDASESRQARDALRDQTLHMLAQVGGGLETASREKVDLAIDSVYRWLTLVHVTGTEKAADPLRSDFFPTELTELSD